MLLLTGLAVQSITVAAAIRPLGEKSDSAKGQLRWDAYAGNNQVSDTGAAGRFLQMDGSIHRRAVIVIAAAQSQHVGARREGEEGAEPPAADRLRRNLPVGQSHRPMRPSRRSW